MGAPKGKLIVLCGFRSDGTLRAIELTDSDHIKTAITTGVGSDLLTALQSIQNLVGALDSVGIDELDVNVEASVLPTGAATSAAQATLLTEVQAKLETADLEIVTSIPSVGDHGWIGGAWQRNPIPLGYSARIVETLSTTASVTGNTDVTSTPVPAGEFHIISSVSIYHNDPTARNMAIYAKAGSIEAAQGYWTSVAIWALSLTTHEIILAPDDYIVGRCFGLLATKTVYMQVWGRRIDIDQ